MTSDYTFIEVFQLSVKPIPITVGPEYMSPAFWGTVHVYSEV